MDMVPKVGAVTPWNGQGGKDPGRRPGQGGGSDTPPSPEPPVPAATRGPDPEGDGAALLEALDRMVAVQPAQDEDSTRILRGRKAYQSNPRLDLPLT
jgi:hypothetical protein